MNSLKQRPFAFSCFLFFIISLIMFFCPKTVKALIFIASVILWVIIFVAKKKMSFFIGYVLPAFILASASSFIYFDVFSNNVYTYDNKECDVKFFITDIAEESEDYCSYTIKTVSIDGRPVSFKSRLSLYDGTKLEPFSEYRANLHFSLIDKSAAALPSSYSFFAQNIFISASSDDSVENLGRTVKVGADYYFYKANSFLSRLTDKYIKGEAGALCKALLLGNREGLSSESSYYFRKLGLSHILAVSGLHLSILATSFELLLKKIVISRRKRATALIFLIAAYAGMTGFSSSVKRASIMLILFYLSFFVSKYSDSVTSLCFAFGAICFFSPGAIFDMGLHLSFISTYGLVAVALPITNKLKIRAKEKNILILTLFIKLLSMLIAGIVPVMFALPVIWLYFGEFAILSPITNIIFTPFLYGIMYTLPLFFVFSFTNLTALSVSFIPMLFAEIMLVTARTLAPYSPIVHINYVFTPIILLFLIASFLIISICFSKKRILYFASLLTCALTFALCLGILPLFTENNPRIIFSNTPSGDSFLLLNNGKAMFCDLSACSSPNAEKCQDILHKNHLSKLDTYLVTDYKGNRLTVLKDLAISTELENIYLPYALDQNDKLLETAYAEFASEYGINTVYYSRKQLSNIEFHGFTLKVRLFGNFEANSPSSYFINISANEKECTYIGNGFFSAPDAVNYLTQYLTKDCNVIVGSYGPPLEDVQTNLFVFNKASIYFASDDVLELYKDRIPPLAQYFVCNQDNLFVFTDNTK